MKKYKKANILLYSTQEQDFEKVNTGLTRVFENKLGIAELYLTSPYIARVNYLDNCVWENIKLRVIEFTSQELKKYNIDESVEFTADQFEIEAYDKQGSFEIIIHSRIAEYLIVRMVFRQLTEKGQKKLDRLRIQRYEEKLLLTDYNIELYKMYKSNIYTGLPRVFYSNNATYVVDRTHYYEFDSFSRKI